MDIDNLLITLQNNITNKPSSLILKYRRLRISSSMLPLTLQLLPKCRVSVNLLQLYRDSDIKELVEKLKKLLPLLKVWFENLEIEEIIYEKGN